MPARLLSLIVAALILVPASPAVAQDEYRAYWVETFNTALAAPADIDRVIGNCVDSNCNAIFAQVRRRGDSWYLDSLEPRNPAVSPTFDPLAYLISQAHARDIEVHAFVIVTAIFSAHPTITGLPPAGHLFRTQFWNTTTNTILPTSSPAMWSTRSLPHNQVATTFDGQRYGAEWYIDLGHPDAALYTVNVLTHLAQQYDVDGIHLDRIRYPEAPIDSIAGRAINVGYNHTSVERFKRRHGDAATYYQPGQVIAGSVGFPLTGDPLWRQWRRDQVTNFVRRLYLSLAEVKPEVKVSAALICNWTGPVGSGGWTGTEAYYRVFQDWKVWAEEGILDLIIPMAYKREHVAAERAQFDDWMSFTKELASANGRHSLIGLGSYLNSIEGSLRQLRRSAAVEPYTSLPASNGSIVYALGNTTPGSLTLNSTNVLVAANPLSYPTPGLSTPRRPNSEFFAAVRTGATLIPYEPTSLTPVWSTFVPAPDAPWKQTLGHISGFAIGSGGPLDAADVAIEPYSGGAPVRRSTSGADGYYGGAGLSPGQYRVIVSLGGQTLWAVPVVSAGAITKVDPQPDVTGPTISVVAPVDGADYVYSEIVPVASFTCDDDLSGVVSCSSSSTFSTGAVGARTFVIDAADRAGNSSSTTTSYEVVRASTTIVVSYEETRNGMTLIATVASVAPATAMPVGMVEFVSANHGLLGTAPLVGGVARLDVQRRSLDLTATYGGTSEFAGAAVQLHLVPRQQ